ncbi:MAG: phosphoglucomutase, partial [Fusobacteriales bacterium]
MRGIRGVGRNRMNKYNIRKATQGLANYIIEHTGELGKEKGVAIAYDCRIDSLENAINTATTLAGNGIKVYLFKSLRTTPELSFAVRKLKTQAGIMITASHNPKEYNGYKVYWEDGAQIVDPPKEYNGYKVYWEDGAQIVDPQAKGIVDAVKAVDIFTGAKYISEKEAIEKNLLVYIDESMDTKYLEAVKKNVINKFVPTRKEFKIVISPLHGTAGRPVKRVLEEIEFENVFVVPEQFEPNGEFPTCAYANPEDTSVFKLSTELADKVGAKLCITNDPDGDRVGIAILDEENKWFYPNGNQIGVLIADYIIRSKQDLAKNATMISTIVSTPLLDTIAKRNGVKTFRTLTGFKY